MEINQGTLQNQRTKVNSKNQNKRRKTLDQKKKKKNQYLYNINNKCWMCLCIVTSNMLKKKLKNVGRALLPTWTSASTFRCSNRTSIVGSSIPTLSKIKKQETRKLMTEIYRRYRPK